MNVQTGSPGPPVPRLASEPGRRRRIVTLTPLIDVVFILLVFFMLASSFMDWRVIRLDAPVGVGGGGMEGALLVELTESGLRLGGTPTTPEAMVRRVREAVAEDRSRRVLVRPDEGVPLQRAVDVLDRLRRTGAEQVSLVRRPGG